MNYFAHTSAVIDEGCEIGAGTKIWHFCHVMPGAIIGQDCVLGQNVFVAGTVKLGNRVKVQNNVSLFDGVSCEDDVFIGPSVVFTNVINPRSSISRKDAYRPTVVRKGATLGANATLLCGIEVGVYAFIGAGAVVTKDVQPYALVTGNPARQTGWMSEAGSQLEFDSSGAAICSITGDTYLLQNSIVVKTR